MSPQEPSPEQNRNRARAFIALRIVSGLLALGVGTNLVKSMRDGYLKLGLGDGRAPTGDYLLLDTPLGFAAGALFLEIIAVFFAIVAINPRYATTPRVWLASIVAVSLLSIVLRFFA